MNVKQLPKFLEDFLELGEIKLTREIKPSWLVGAFNDDYWKIIIPNESRLINGIWSGCRTISWQFRVPSGYLTDSRWDQLLTHAKLMCISHIESPIAKTSNPRSLTNFQCEILNLCEHLIIHYPIECELMGLAAFSNDKRDRYLADHFSAGTAGTGNWVGRWEHFIFSQLDSEDFSRQYEKWMLNQGDDTLASINCVSRPIKTVDSQEYQFVISAPYDSHNCLKARQWLAMHSWYDERGCIDFDRVADAIEVNSQRIAGNPYLKYSFRILEQCSDYRKLESTWTYREYMGHKTKTVTEKATGPASAADQALTYSFLSAIADYSKHIQNLDKSPLAELDMTRLSRCLVGHDKKRTATLPVNTALFVYDKMIEWALQYSKPLMQYYLDLLRYTVRRQGDARRTYGTKKTLAEMSGEDCVWEKAFEHLPMPTTLNGLNLHRVAPILNKRAESRNCRNNFGGSELPSLLRKHGMTVIDAMGINTAVIAGLIAALSLRRRGEVLTLNRDCAFLRGQRPYLQFDLEKVGIDGVRDTVSRPIPTFLYETLIEYQSFSNTLVASETYRSADPFLAKRLFILPTDTGGKILDSNNLGIYLDLFSDWIQVPLDSNNRRWYIRMHECRRFGAMSFFRLSGMDASLPALSWFLGHKSIKETWRYVQDELTGKELTQCEVAMAHEAIINANHRSNIEGADALNSAVLRHFGVDRLDVISPCDVDEFLEILHEEGVYRIELHSLCTAEDRAHTILIHMIKDPVCHG